MGELTQPDFAISDEIAGVNMYLERGRLSHLPPALVSQHLNVPEEVLATFPRGTQGITPLR